MAGTGLGATVSTFTGLTVANWNYRSISGLNRSVEELDDTHLASTDHMEKCPADLASIGPTEIEVYWEFGEPEVVTGAVGTCTIGLPPQGGLSGGMYSGTGFISAVNPPTMTPNDRTIGTIVWSWDGKTGPTWTANT